MKIERIEYIEYEDEDSEMGETLSIDPVTRKLRSYDAAMGDYNKVDRNNNLLTKLWNLYLTDETANSVVNALATFTLGDNFLVVPEGTGKEVEEEYLRKPLKDAKTVNDEKTENSIKNIENKDLVNKEKKEPDKDILSSKDKTFWVEFYRFNWIKIWELVAEALVFGNSFAFKVTNKAKELYALEPLYPLEVKKTQSENGTIEYEYSKNKYGSDKIFELYFYPRSDSIYATSYLEPILKAITRKITSESSIDTALTRHVPRFHIVTHRDSSTSRYPTATERYRMAKKFESLSPDQDFVSTDGVEIKEIDKGGGIPKIEDYMMYFTNSIFIGARIPPEVLGGLSKSTTYATAKSRANAFLSFTIPFYQRNLEFHLKNQLMKDSKYRLEILPPKELAMEYAKSKDSLDGRLEEMINNAIENSLIKPRNR